MGADLLLRVQYGDNSAAVIRTSPTSPLRELVEKGCKKRQLDPTLFECSITFDSTDAGGPDSGSGTTTVPSPSLSSSLADYEANGKFKSLNLSPKSLSPPECEPGDAPLPLPGVISMQVIDRQFAPPPPPARAVLVEEAPTEHLPAQKRALMRPLSFAFPKTADSDLDSPDSESQADVRTADGDKLHVGRKNTLRKFRGFLKFVRDTAPAFQVSASALDELSTPRGGSLSEIARNPVGAPGPDPTNERNLSEQSTSLPRTGSARVTPLRTYSSMDDIFSLDKSQNSAEKLPNSSAVGATEGPVVSGSRRPSAEVVSVSVKQIDNPSRNASLEVVTQDIMEPMSAIVSDTDVDVLATATEQPSPPPEPSAGTGTGDVTETAIPRVFPSILSPSSPAPSTLSPLSTPPVSPPPLASAPSSMDAPDIEKPLPLPPVASAPTSLDPSGVEKSLPPPPVASPPSSLNAPDVDSGTSGHQDMDASQVEPPHHDNDSAVTETSFNASSTSTLPTATSVKSLESNEGQTKESPAASLDRPKRLAGPALVVPQGLTSRSPSSLRLEVITAEQVEVEELRGDGAPTDSTDSADSGEALDRVHSHSRQASGSEGEGHNKFLSNVRNNKRNSALFALRKNQYRQFRPLSDVHDVVRPCDPRDMETQSHAVLAVKFPDETSGHFRVSRMAELETVLSELCGMRALLSSGFTFLAGTQEVELDRSVQHYLDLTKLKQLRIVTGKKRFSTRAVNEDGRDVMIVREVEGKELVLAATVDKLIEHITPEDEAKSDPDFLDTLLLTFRSFTSPMDFLNRLIDRFESNTSDSVENSVDELYYRNMERKVKAGMVATVVRWTKDHWHDFYIDSDLRLLLEDFVETLESCHDNALGLDYREPCVRLRSTMEQQSQVYAERERHRHLVRKGKALPGLQQLLIQITPEHLAEQLCLHNSRLLRNIQPTEYLNLIWQLKPAGNDDDNDSSALNFFVERFNRESHWVATEICSIADDRIRRRMLKKFILVAKASAELNNFFSTFSILGGLNHPSVRRMKRTMDLKDKYKVILADLESLCDPSRNMKRYRDRVAVTKPPMIPFLAIYFKDLTFMNDGNKSVIRDMVNFDKLRMMGSKVSEMIRIAQTPYPFAPMTDAQNYITNPPVEKDSKKLLAMSSEREP